MARRKKKQNKFGAYVIMIFMVLLMVGSLLGVILFAPQASGEITYGEFTFTVDLNTGQYTTMVDGTAYSFSNLPYTALSVPTSQEAINLLRTAPLLVMTFDPTLEQEELQYVDFVRFELASVFANLGGGITQPSATYALPIIDCVNATATTPIILIESGDPEIRLEEFCVVLSGNRTTLLLAKDALLYNYFGMFEEGVEVTIPAPQPVQPVPLTHNPM